ncbi:aldehyde dehydrogenase family protein [Egicoccus sp. AB-alg2]|uniref:aldehyde dehydrogenase family protein n=1 Tax=Egicoccus sp. AB-alg2 TaxID=3242693 RepID=UPI00359D5D97
MDVQSLETLVAGQPLVFGGDRVTHVSAELAEAFAPGDALVVLQDTGEILHVPRADRQAARAAVDAAVRAFGAMGAVDDAQLDAFYTAFADHLEDDERFAAIAAANEADVARARERGRSTTRLVLSDRMRADMVAGLRNWTTVPSPRGEVMDTREYEGWTLEQVSDRLGVVAFVFEGRPNVFADACGVLRGGNTVVFRIGSDALGTARAIVEHALDPALEAAGLPAGAASLVDAPSHAAGWALFADPRLSLAVARGSGEAVRQLSAVAQQAGNAVSAHGTGGAWLVATAAADTGRFAAAVHRSLDRKVCNTLNVCCIVRERADDLVPTFLDALDRAAADRGTNAKLHVVETTRDHVPAERFEKVVPIARAEGDVEEAQAEPLLEAQLGVEWEWEDSPELTLVVVDDLDHALELFNRYSPRFVLSVVSEDEHDRQRAWRVAEAPYVGTGFTRWVDGQYALGTPELGLSNWELGRLFGRSGILSGDAIRTVRSRVTQHDPDVHR